MLSVIWKTSEKIYSDLQGNSSCYTGYSDTMQVMVNAGVHVIDGYHRGAPQLIQLGIKCTGNPKIKVFHIPMKHKASFVGSKHMQSNYHLKGGDRSPWPHSPTYK